MTEYKVTDVARAVGIDANTIRNRVKNNYYLGKHSYTDESGENKTITITSADVKGLDNKDGKRLKIRLSENFLTWAIIEQREKEKNEELELIKADNYEDSIDIEIISKSMERVVRDFSMPGRLLSSTQKQSIELVRNQISLLDEKYRSRLEEKEIELQEKNKELENIKYTYELSFEKKSDLIGSNGKFLINLDEQLAKNKLIDDAKKLVEKWRNGNFESLNKID